MTITRTINGVEMEFELKEQEIWAAFREFEHWGAKNDVDKYCKENDVSLTEEEKDIATLYYWKKKDDCDCWNYVLENAVERVIEERMVD